VVEQLVEDLPILRDRSEIRIPGGPLVSLGQNQIVLWVSLTPGPLPDEFASGSSPFPPSLRRFPAILDTGFNGTFLMNERHFRQWGLVNPELFPRFDRYPGMRFLRKFTADAGLAVSQSEAGSNAKVVSDLEVPYRQAMLWLHRNQSGHRDQIAPVPPTPLFLSPGLAILPANIDDPVIPLIGMRCLISNRLRIIIDSDRATLAMERMIT
jgi:hypothetical protein